MPTHSLIEENVIERARILRNWKNFIVLRLVESRNLIRSVVWVMREGRSLSPVEIARKGILLLD